MSQTFPYYIEDWLLWLATRRTITGDEIDFPWYADPPINLANYDVSFIMRTSAAIDNGIGLTHNQKELALKIITKYQRQIWSNIKRDVEYLIHAEDITRLELRDVDKSFRVQADDNFWYVLFPYDPPMVDNIHKLSAHSAGTFKWEGKEKRWYIDRNECNLWLLCCFLKQWKAHPWKIDKDIAELVDQAEHIVENRYQYLPHIDLLNSKLVVKNSNRFIDQAWERIQGLDFYNSVFRANSIGLCVSEQVNKQVLELLPTVGNAIITPQWKINTSSKSLNTVLPCNLVNDFAQHIHADNWVFISYDNTSSTGLLEAGMDAEVNGEKIFFSDKVPRLSYNHFNQVKELNGDTILFVDNLTILNQVNKHLLPEFPVLRTFYSHGGKR